MPTYVIFHRKTGELVHTHIEPEGVDTSKEGLLSMVDPSYDPSDLDVKLVDPDVISIGDAFQIEVDSGRLRASALDETAGSGSGIGRPFDLEVTTRSVKTIYERELSDSPSRE